MFTSKTKKPKLFAKTTKKGSKCEHVGFQKLSLEKTICVKKFQQVRQAARLIFPTTFFGKDLWVVVHPAKASCVWLEAVS